MFCLIKSIFAIDLTQKSFIMQVSSTSEELGYISINLFGDHMFHHSRFHFLITFSLTGGGGGVINRFVLMKLPL